MDKAQNIPAGKKCQGKTFTCPWLYDGNWCELASWQEENRCDGIRSESCRAAYPHGATVTVTPK